MPTTSTVLKISLGPALILIFLAAASISTPASAQGFNCRYARTPDEVRICKSEHLRGEDELWKRQGLPCARISPTGRSARQRIRRLSYRLSWLEGSARPTQERPLRARRLVDADGKESTLLAPIGRAKQESPRNDNLSLVLAVVASSVADAFACSPAPSCWIDEGPAYLKEQCRQSAKNPGTLKYLDEPDQIGRVIRACAKHHIAVKRPHKYSLRNGPVPRRGQLTAPWRASG